MFSFSGGVPFVVTIYLVLSYSFQRWLGRQLHGAICLDFLEFELNCCRRRRHHFHYLNLKTEQIEIQIHFLASKKFHNWIKRVQCASN